MQFFKFATRMAVMALAASVITACNSPPPATPTSETDRDIILGTEVFIDSEILGEQRSLSVYLPMGYDQRNQSFPVLYLIDGGVDQDFIPVAGFAALATLSGQYEEFIVIGVKTNNRRYELTTPSDNDFDVRMIPDNGGADEFRRFINEEVQPFVDERYRTTGDTTVMGESLAGQFIMKTMLTEPVSFNHYIAVSPSVWWRDMEMSRNAADSFQNLTFPEGTTLYLSNANEEDMAEGVAMIVAALVSHKPDNLTYWYEPMPDEQHHTIYHRASLNALRWTYPMPE